MLSVHGAPTSGLGPTPSAEQFRAIRRLRVVCNVLLIAAHPDDENTRLLSWLVHAQGVRTAYLSLTRGEGGQNLIGPERAPLLGLIRAQELLAARRIDGAEQFFGGQVDFGYSKSREETLNVWNKEQALAEVVAVIRHFRPDVILTRFSPDERDTHGHHTTSALPRGRSVRRGRGSGAISRSVDGAAAVAGHARGLELVQPRSQRRAA